MKDNRFKLSQTVWYSKGWYKRSDDIFEDLKQTLNRDGYAPQGKKDILRIITARLEDFSIVDTNRTLRIEASDIINNIYSRQFVSNILEKSNYGWEEFLVEYLMSIMLNFSKDEWLSDTTEAYENDKDNIKLK